MKSQTNGAGAFVNDQGSHAFGRAPRIRDRFKVEPVVFCGESFDNNAERRKGAIVIINIAEVEETDMIRRWKGRVGVCCG